MAFINSMRQFLQTRGMQYVPTTVFRRNFSSFCLPDKDARRNEIMLAVMNNTERALQQRQQQALDRAHLREQVRHLEQEIAKVKKVVDSTEISTRHS